MGRYSASNAFIDPLTRIALRETSRRRASSFRACATKRGAGVPAPGTNACGQSPRSMGIVARATGLEPATSGVTGRRSNQLNYARKYDFVGGRTFRRATPASQSKGHPPMRAFFAADSNFWRRMVGDDGLEPPTPSV